MTDNNTALERIMSKRRRPAVSSRADVVSESLGQDVKTSLSQDSSDKRRDVVKTNSPQDMIEVVRSTTRLEKSVDTALRHLCTDERITKEVWFEAAYLYLSEQPEAMTIVNDLAKKRLNERKELADIRRAQTMKEKLESRENQGV